MKKILGAAILTVGILAIVSACSKGYTTQKAAGDLKITLTADRYPLVSGDNALSVAIADASGKTPADAVVAVHYYMPAMPGMAPMDYPAQTTVRNGAYAFNANIAMGGGWKVDVSVTQPGKAAVVATFNVDAR
jgi:hypothetical protein